MSRRKIFALILFIFMSLFIFTFANPGGPFEIGSSPVITVDPELVKIIEGTDYNVMTGVTVTDDVDQLTATADITDTKALEIGEHTITYTAVDTDNNVGVAIRTIKILDPNGDEDSDNYTNIEEQDNDSDFDDPNSVPRDLAPIIRVIPAIVKIMPGITYNVMTGVTVTDDFDTVTVAADITNTAVLPIGNNAITYTSTRDRILQRDTATRTVRVLDPKADEDGDGYTNGEEDIADTNWDDVNEYPDYPKEPAITLGENNIYQIEVHSDIPTFTATAFDVADGVVVVDIDNNIDNHVVGTYTVTFTATDSLGNIATITRDFKVVDTTAPVIDLNGSDYIKVVQGTVYGDEGALVTDNYDTDVTIYGTYTLGDDLSIFGEHDLTYRHDDANGNSAIPVIRTIKVLDPKADEDGDGYTNGEELLADTDFDDEEEYPDYDKAPTITLDEDNVYSMEVHTTKPIFKATATDVADGVVDVDITDDIDEDIVGTYTVTFTATDSLGNIKTIERDFYVVDTTIPVIHLNGDETVYHEAKTPYVDLGATALDNYDGDITSSIVVDESNLNINLLGTYTIKYNVTDANHNDAVTVTRTVIVRDTTKPVITKKVASDIYLEVGSDLPAIADLVTANDNYDGDITDEVYILTMPNLNLLNTYLVEFYVLDSSGNRGYTPLRVHVVDRTAPVITKKVASDIYLEVGSDLPAIADLVTANDNYDGDITDEVYILTMPNMNLLNTYLVEFYVFDSSGNRGYTPLRVHVVDRTAPVIHLNGAASVVTRLNSIYTDLGAYATDNYDASVTVMTTNPVTTAIAGKYTVTYNATDISGNHADPVTRQVEVVDIRALQAAIVDGNSILSYTDGRDVSPILANYLDLLEDAITFGNGVISNMNSTQEQVDDAKDDIQYYIDQIRSMVFEVTFKDYDNTLIIKVPVTFAGAAIPPMDPERLGYTFAYWSNSFTDVVNNITTIAVYTPNTNTPYKIVHLTENLDGTYDIEAIENKTGTTNTTASATANDYDGFTYNAGLSNMSGNIAADGTLTLNVVYRRNSYTITYKVDGVVDSTASYKFEAPVTMKPTPTKEGHTFIGWDTTVITMPSNDVIVSGTFSAITYNAYFYINNVLSYTVPTVFGQSIVTPSYSVAAGYTFSGWTGVDVMGAGDINFYATVTANTNTTYKIIHMTENLDGTYSVRATENKTGTTDTTANATANDYDGFTYSAGLSNMSGNIAGNGSLELIVKYTRNSYIITYKVDGVIDSTASYKFEAPVTMKPTPTKEGHTFIGWDTTIITMPFNDVVVSGTFTVNTHDIVYNVDGEQYQLITDVAYGTSLTAIPEPTERLGYVFSGWSTVPATMPDHDVVINGTFTINITLSSITATLNPYTYIVGQSIGTLIVTANYSNGTSAIVTNYTSSPFNTSTPTADGTERTITITYIEAGITKTTTVAYRVVTSHDYAGYIVLTKEATQIKAEFFAHDNIKQFKYYVTSSPIVGDFNTIINTIMTNGIEITNLTKIPGTTGNNQKYGYITPLVSGKYYYVAGENASNKTTDYQVMYIQ